jgi:hypothetical protein
MNPATTTAVSFATLGTLLAGYSFNASSKFTLDPQTPVVDLGTVVDHPGTFADKGCVAVHAHYKAWETTYNFKGRRSRTYTNSEWHLNLYANQDLTQPAILSLSEKTNVINGTNFLRTRLAYVLGKTDEQVLFVITVDNRNQIHLGQHFFVGFNGATVPSPDRLFETNGLPTIARGFAFCAFLGSGLAFAVRQPSGSPTTQKV